MIHTRTAFSRAPHPVHPERLPARRAVLDWNVVVTARPGAFREARRLLSRLGAVETTPYLNVFVLRVEDRAAFLEELRRRRADSGEGFPLARVLPASRVFSFQTPEEFRLRSGEIIREWAPLLSGRRFHVRVHRRGFKFRLSSGDEERRLGEAVLEAVWGEKEDAQVSLEDADLVIVVETVGGKAGMALVSREERERYAFIRPD